MGERSTFNAQPSTLNSILDVGRSAFDVFCKVLIPLQNIAAFRRSLLRWYRKNGRDLPWRRTADPYAILVSEFMLHQTQVSTVVPYYNEWLRRFPDFAALAAAPDNDVLHAWQGLGYYRRARNLHAIAKVVQDRHDGILPRDPAAIREFPGIGRYTANAIATFAFDQSVPVVETNITRLLARVFNYTKPVDSAAGRDAIWRIAAAIVPTTGARIYNSALMDLAALVCRTRPKCQICPVRKFCRAIKPEALPRKKARLPVREITERHAWIRNRRGLLLEQSPRRWRGMWILPSVRSTSDRPIHTSVFPFTNHRVTLQVFDRPARKIDHRHQRWFSTRALETIPIPSPHRRAIVDLLH
jgi:A/G-specific adenine glycosylase